MNQRRWRRLIAASTMALLATPAAPAHARCDIQGCGSNSPEVFGNKVVPLM